MHAAVVRKNWYTLVSDTDGRLPSVSEASAMFADLGVNVHTDDKLSVHVDGVGNPPDGWHWVAPAEIVDEHAANIISTLAMKA